MIKETIKIPIYFGNLVILQLENLSEINKDYNLNLGINHEACVFDEISPKGIHNYVIAFEAKVTLKIIAHECIHLVNRVFIDRGIKLDLTNDEPQAYLMGWFFEQCETFLKKHKL